MNDKELGENVGIVLRDMYPEPSDVRLVLTASSRSSHRLATVAGAAGVAVLVAVVAIVVPESRNGREPSTAASSSTSAPSPSATNHGSLNDHEYSIAVEIARHEAKRTARSLTSATATETPGTVTDSNTGHQCISGRVLHIKLIGDFNIATGDRRPARAGWLAAARRPCCADHGRPQNRKRVPSVCRNRAGNSRPRCDSSPCQLTKATN